MYRRVWALWVNATSSSVRVLSIFGFWSSRGMLDPVLLGYQEMTVQRSYIYTDTEKVGGEPQGEGKAGRKGRRERRQREVEREREVSLAVMCNEV